MGVEMSRFSFSCHPSGAPAWTSYRRHSVTPARVPANFPTIGIPFFASRHRQPCFFRTKINFCAQFLPEKDECRSFRSWIFCSRRSSKRVSLALRRSGFHFFHVNHKVHCRRRRYHSPRYDSQIYGTHIESRQCFVCTLRARSSFLMFVFALLFLIYLFARSRDPIVHEQTFVTCAFILQKAPVRGKFKLVLRAKKAVKFVKLDGS